MKVGKTEQHQFFMQRAIELAETHMMAMDGGPFGAVVVKDGKIVAEGWNKVTSSNDPTAHAEVVAIRRAGRTLKNFDLSDCELFSSCEPCPMCLAAAYWAGIRKISYGADHNDAAAHGFNDAFIYQELCKSMEERKMIMVQLMRSEAVTGFKRWDAFEEKTRY